MFTGIVSAVGTVVTVEPNRLAIEHASTVRALRVGSSVAVNGCCLTVVARKGGTFAVEVVPETLRRTNLGLLTRGATVNLELPLRFDGLLDGHLVQGHVDARTTVRRVTGVAAGREVTFGLPAAVARFVVEKGSIAIDGVSLTIAAVSDRSRSFRVAFIPHTLASTIAGRYVRGVAVNLEADVVARYVARNLRR